MRCTTYFLFLCLLSCTNRQQPVTTIVSRCYKLKDITQTKHAAQPGEWRDSYTEVHEPLQAYLRREPTAATAQRHTLYVVQLGTFDEKGKQILHAAKAYLQAFYQIPVAELPPVSIKTIPAIYTRQNTYGLQLQTVPVLDSLLPSLLPGDAFALIAFATCDLYPDENWNFVFGQASLERRVGVWSLARLGDYNKDSHMFNICLRRTIHVAAHETGHMFGIRHCVQNECCMNGSNSLAESDGQPLWLCWECLAKVCYNRRIYPETQVQSLLDFHKKFTHDKEALQYYSKAAQLLKQ